MIALSSAQQGPKPFPSPVPLETWLHRNLRPYPGAQRLLRSIHPAQILQATWSARFCAANPHLRHKASSTR